MDKNYHTAPRNFKRWSKHADTQLKRMIKKGFNSEEIATELGRTRASVLARKFALGIENKITPARGSKMPYTGFSKSSQAEKPSLTSETTVASASELQDNSQFGHKLDLLITQARSMGLKLQVTITSED